MGANYKGLYIEIGFESSELNELIENAKAAKENLENAIKALSEYKVKIEVGNKK